MTRTLIAFTGYAGSGKSAACWYLVRDHRFSHASFADPLKRMAQIAFGFTEAQLWGPSSEREKPDTRYPLTACCPWCGGPIIRRYEERPDLLPQALIGFECAGPCFRNDLPTHVTPRLALQTLGTEWGRRLYRDIWAEACIRHIDEAGTLRWCISDLRFPNEVAAVKKAGGIVVRLTRGAKRFDHESENLIDELDVDQVIGNTGSLPDLFAALDVLVRSQGG